MGIFSTVVPWLTKHKERIAILGIGIMADRAIAYSFDFGLYPFVIWRAGPLWGGVVMAFLSLLICLLTIWFYDWSKKDWLGIEAIKELKVYEGTSRIGRFFAWLMKKGDPVAVMVFDRDEGNRTIDNNAFNPRLDIGIGKPVLQEQGGIDEDVGVNEELTAHGVPLVSAR